MGVRAVSTRPRASHQDHWTNAGVLAARAWLAERGVRAPDGQRWHADITLAVSDAPAEPAFNLDTDTRFRIEIYSEEWGFFFCHGGHASWIRITDIPFVHGRDDFKLLELTPPLKELSRLVRVLENRHTIRFRREHALVRTNVAGAEPAVRRWVLSL